MNKKILVAKTDHRFQIFGYKQQGQAAVDSVNVYHHLFYEGNVDVFSIQVCGDLRNFGELELPGLKSY